MAGAETGDPDQDRAQNVVNSVLGTVLQVRDVHGDVVVVPSPDRLAIEVSCEPAEIESMPSATALIESWLAAERTRLLASADTYDWSQNERLPGLLDLEYEVRPGFRDLRTRETYESYVEEYLRQAEEVLEQRVLLLLEEHEGAGLQLVVSNVTDLHFHGVELRVWFGDEVLGLDDELRYDLPSNWPELPPVPAPPGASPTDVIEQQRVMSPPRRIKETTREALAARGEDVLDGWSGRDFQGGFVVDFERFDLRPGEDRLIPVVPLRVLASPGSVLHGEWDATADSARGKCSGDLELAVLPSTADLALIAEPGPPTRNNASAAEAIMAVATLFLMHRRRPIAGG